MDPTLFEDYAPAAPAKPQHGDDAPELVPYLHFAWLCNVLAGVAAPLGDSYETFAVDGDAQGSSSAPPDGPDDDPLVPYGAFKFIAEAVDAMAANSRSGRRAESSFQGSVRGASSFNS